MKEKEEEERLAHQASVAPSSLTGLGEVSTAPRGSCSAFGELQSSHIGPLSMTRAGAEPSLARSSRSHECRAAIDTTLPPHDNGSCSRSVSTLLPIASLSHHAGLQHRCVQGFQADRADAMDRRRPFHTFDDDHRHHTFERTMKETDDHGEEKPENKRRKLNDEINRRLAAFRAPSAIASRRCRSSSSPSNIGIGRCRIILSHSRSGAFSLD